MKASTVKRKEVVLSQEQQDQIANAFRLLDREDEGVIESRELKLFFIALGFQLKKEEIKQMIRDNEKNGLIEFEQVKVLAERKMAQRDPIEQIRLAFKLFDEDKGKVSLRELKKASRELGQIYMEEELFELIAQASTTGDGEVSQEDFIRIMKKTKLFGVLN